MKKHIPHDSTCIPEHPALVGAAHRFRDARGDYWVGYAHTWVRLRSNTVELEPLFDLLDGTRTRDRVSADACARFPGLGSARVLQLLTALAKRGLLMEGQPVHRDLSANDFERHSRDLEFYALYERPGHSRMDYLARVRSARIAVVGLGGIGSWLLLSLAGLGVGMVVGIDADVVEMSNLGRQVLYTPDMVGRPKVEAAMEFMSSFAPETRYVARSACVSASEDVAPLVGDVDLVVVAADWPPRRLASWVNAACMQLAIPAIYVSGGATHINVGPLVDPRTEDGGCYECYTVLRRERAPGFAALDGGMMRLSQETFAAEPTPVLSPIPGLAGQALAWEVLCAISDIATPQTCGHVLNVDLTSFSARPFPIPRQPNCAICRAYRQGGHEKSS